MTTSVKRAMGYQSTQNLNVIVEKHASLVKKVACHLIARLPPSVQLDDLIQSGMIGLIEASKNFDASKGQALKRLLVFVFAALCLMKCAEGIGHHVRCTAKAD